MPPKKGKKTSKKRKDDKEGTDKLSELDKEIFNSQIRNLEEKLKLYQTKYCEMESSCLSYKLRVEQVTNDKQNIVAFLRNTLDQRADEIAELQERLDGLQKARDADNAAREKEFQQLKLQYQETKDQLTSENIVLSGKLASLEEFKQQKEETLKKIEVLNGSLKQQESEHRETVRNIEKHNVLAIDKLKMDMKQNLENIAANFRQISNKQMSETTRRAIQENAALSAQVGKLVEKITRLSLENQSLVETNSKQKLHINTLEGIETDLVKRNCTLLKVIKESDVKLKGQENVVNDLELYTTKYLKMDRDLAKLQDEVKILKNETLIKTDLIQKVESKLQTTTLQLDKIQGQKKHLEDVIYSATNTLKETLRITKEGLQITTDQQVSKDNILNHLLNILMTSKCLLESPSDGKRQSGVSLPLLLPHQQSRMNILETGGIGLVPRPSALLPISKPVKKHRYDEIQRNAGFCKPKSATFPSSDRIMDRKIKSAAYRILHETGCSTKNSSFGEKVRKMEK